VALTQIDRRLNQLYPNRLGHKALMGYSMGALESLYIAANESANLSSSDIHATHPSRLITFDRYVAINTPVRLLHGVAKLDEFYRAPLAWPMAKRTDNIENTFLKVAALSQSTFAPQTSLPFDAIESKFLIGLDFRLVLRDIIYSSQRRDNLGILHHALWSFLRKPVYQEILQYSYQDYYDQFAVPYYSRQGLNSATAAMLERAGDLRTYGAALRANSDVRVIVNENDFLLEDDDLAWLHATFSPENLTVFKQGGHLGNLSNPAVQKAILAALTPMRPPELKSPRP
jgi:pimeloyl-ACP methyl ester carboxylesterase